MRAVFAAVAAAVLLVLVGCTSNEKEFVDAMRADVGSSLKSSITDAEVMALGEGACDVMDSQTVVEFVMNGIDMGYGTEADWEGMGQTFRLAGEILCPEHADWMDQ